MRRTVPLVIAFSVGVVLLFQYFNPGFYVVYEEALKWGPVIGGIVAYLGIISFLRHHWTKAKRKSQDWAFSVASLVAFTVMVIAGFWGVVYSSSYVAEEDAADYPVWPEVAFQDPPTDRGGVIEAAWKLENRVGDIRTFEIHRRLADGSDSDFKRVRTIPGTEHRIGKPDVNRDELGEKLPTLIENGGFHDGLDGWTPGNGVTTREDENHGVFAVIPAGSTLESPAVPLTEKGRLRFEGACRALTKDASLTVKVLVEGRDDPIHELVKTKLAEDEWSALEPAAFAQDILVSAKASVRLRFEAKGGQVAIDDVEIRPAVIDFLLRFKDNAPWNRNADFLHYGEQASILTRNYLFEMNTDGWTGMGATREKRVDKYEGYCARIPAGSTFTSAACRRTPDPMGEKLRYRFRGWGRGGESGLRAELLAVKTGGAEVVCGSVEWEPDSGWDILEFEEAVEVPPLAEAPTLKVRYTATGSKGFAEVDDVHLISVKMNPAKGVEYVYKIVALDADGNKVTVPDADGNAMTEAVSEPIAGTWEVISSYESQNGLFTWLFNYILVPMEATMFALLAFFIASAAFRAFRARSVEATMLLIAAIFVMVGRVPIGEWVWAPLGHIADWIMEYPNGGAKRAIMIGVGLGMAATSLKLMLGLERAYLGKG